MATPPRSNFYDVVMDLVSTSATFGKPISDNIQVAVYVAVPAAGTPLTTLASIFSAETGAGTPGNPFTLPLSGLGVGEISFWAAPGTYDIRVQDTTSPPRFATRVVRWDALPYDKGVQTAMMADDAITGSKVASGTIPLTDLDSTAQSRLIAPGMIFPFAGILAAVPAGYLPCDGSVVASATYPALDALFGAAAPGGATHAFNGGSQPSAGNFKLPDLRSRSPIGSSVAAGGAPALDGGLTSRALGTKLGVETHPLSIAEMAAHAHPGSSVGNELQDHAHSMTAENLGGTAPSYIVPGTPFGGGARNVWRASGVLNTGGTDPAINTIQSNGAFSYGVGIGGVTNFHQHALTIASQGSGTAHQNMQPSQAVTYIIKT